MVLTWGVFGGLFEKLYLNRTPCSFGVLGSIERVNSVFVSLSFTKKKKKLTVDSI